MTYLENCDYFVRVVPLPFSIRGMISTNPDGTFNIYLNSRNTHAQQQWAKKHEFEHMVNDDFYNGKSIEEIENL